MELIYQNLTHTFEPVYNSESEILILGSFPSVKSRENHFYYGHPQNRFWKVLAHIWKTNVPETIEEKKALLLDNHIAIWDVIASCSIVGSSDTSIKDVVVNDFSAILKDSKIDRIYVNGGKAYELYHRYAEKDTGIKAIKLPSTSPANAAWSLERLCKEWEVKCMETMYFVVINIDGDYAHLKRTDVESDDLKLVARALLPDNIAEGTALKYEMLQYEICE